MRNKHIKYCDVNGIQDGVLRVFLTNGDLKPALDSIPESINRSLAKIKALKKLQTRLSDELEI